MALVRRSERSSGLFEARDAFSMRSAMRAWRGLHWRAEGIGLQNSDRLCDVDGRRRPIGFAAHREAAHLTLDAALVAAMPAGRHAFLQDFVEDRAMQRRPVQRGEWR